MTAAQPRLRRNFGSGNMNQQSSHAWVGTGGKSKPILPGKEAGVVLRFFRVLVGKPNEGGKLGGNFPWVHGISLLFNKPALWTLFTLRAAECEKKADVGV